VKVLYVNHTSLMSGAELSLLELLSALPYDIDPVVACPEGELAEEVRLLAIPVVPLPGIGVSFRLHPWHTPWGLAQMGAAAAHLRRLAQAYDARIVHANSIRSGLVAGLAASFGGPPAIVHVRDCMPPGRTADLVRGFLRPRAAAVFANSCYTAQNFLDGSALPPARVVYNAVDLERFDPDLVDRDRARARLGIGSDRAALGIVSQITPWKALDDAIRILAGVRGAGIDASLFVVGSAKFTEGSIRFDNESFDDSLRRLVAENGLSGYVHFLGERREIPEIVRALDVVLVPSWEEPFGRIVIEAMAMRTPVVTTNVGGPQEILGDESAGLLLPPRATELWSREVARLLEDDSRREKMGAIGERIAAERFTRERHLEDTLAGYHEVLAAFENGGGGSLARKAAAGAPVAPSD
jgi:glycosyltransferase involved in cell wall biosynthesis